MKKSLLVGCLFTMALVSCKDNQGASSKIDLDNAKKVEQESTQARKYPKISFDRSMHDFGNVANNEAVFTEFVLTNTGDSELIIIGATASCGCTVPEYQKTPILPGESSVLKVRFQQAQQGMQQKTVNLTTNTEKGEEILVIKANVLPRNN
ncbi:DUF1573 domain-containing protein [Myroides sp. LJL116]